MTTAVSADVRDSVQHHRAWLTAGAASGLVAAAAFALSVVVGGAIVPGYSHLADSVSSLTSPGAPFRAGLAVGFVVYNAAVVVLGIALPNLTSSPRRSLQVVRVLLIACGVAGVLMIEPFPQDLPGTPGTPGGTVHIVLALVSALTLVVATFLTAAGFHRDPAFGRLRWPSIVAGIAILVTGGLGSAALAMGSPFFGAIERLTQLSFLSWFAAIGVTAILALRRTRG